MSGRTRLVTIGFALLLMLVFDVIGMPSRLFAQPQIGGGSSGGSTTYTVTAGGRLTLESGVCVSTSDQTAKASVFYTPCFGAQISLFDGSATWSTLTFAETTLALGTITTGTNYDVFGYSSSGTLALELSAAWASATARTDALALQDGVWVKSSAKTRRYLGTIRTTSATTTEDSATKRFVWNVANRVARTLVRDDTTSHSYNGNYRQWNATAANQVEFVRGLDLETLTVGMISSFNNLGTSYSIAAVGLDSTSTPIQASIVVTLLSAGNIDLNSGTSIVQRPGIGYHFLAALESTLNGGAQTFYEIHLQATVWG